MSFNERCNLIKSHYETVHLANRRETIWNSLNLIEEIQKFPDKLQAFNNLERELRRVQRGLEAHYGDAALRTRIINACSGMVDLHFVLFSPAKTAEGVCADVRARFMQISSSGIATCQYPQHEFNEFQEVENAYLAERQYQTARGSGIGRSDRPFYESGKDSSRMKESSASSSWKKRFLICKKANCWSTNHSAEERGQHLTKSRKSTRQKMKMLFASSLSNSKENP